MNLDVLIGLALAGTFALYLLDLFARVEIPDGAAGDENQRREDRQRCQDAQYPAESVRVQGAQYGQYYSISQLVPIRGQAPDQPRTFPAEYR